MIVLVLVLAGMVSCGGTDDDTTARSEGSTEVWVRPSMSEESGQAEISGTLAVADGCFVIESDSGSFPVVWPTGTASASDGALVLPDRTSVEVGDQLRGAGEYVSPELLKERGMDFEIPDDCLPSTNEVAMFGDDEISVSAASD
jgi:hypothetical protein